MSSQGVFIGPQKWWADKNLRSLRFNSADTAYLSRTPASSGNRKTWTWAGWVKRSALGADHMVFDANNGSDYFSLLLNSNNTCTVYNRISATNYYLTTTAVFRDPSAWAHIVVAVDTTAATPSNRVKLYINNSQVTTFSSAQYPLLDALTQVNNTVAHQIGNRNGQSVYFSGYLADIHFIDGQALEPTAFGEFDDNGIWQPQTYFGDYGTNGFRLNFGDNTSTSTLGLDSSGQGNHWTSNNLSVTAGAGNDSMVDHPVHYGFDTGVGGEVRGNYCTLNPLDKGGGVALSNGNLDLTTTSGNQCVSATIALPSSGKWYYEGTAGSNTLPPIFGISKAPLSTKTYVGSTSDSWGYYGGNGGIYNNASVTATVATYGTGDIIGVAFDADAGSLKFYKNNSLQHTVTGLTGEWFFAVGGATMTASINFGQRPFAYTAPSGFKALCTTNLPENTGITTSGTFTGNSSANGPFIYLNGIPTAMTINGNSVTFGTHADKLSNGFKVRNSTSSYNASGSNTFTISSTGDNFKEARAQENP